MTAAIFSSKCTRNYLAVELHLDPLGRGAYSAIHIFELDLTVGPLGTGGRRKRKGLERGRGRRGM